MAVGRLYVATGPGRSTGGCACPGGRGRTGCRCQAAGAASGAPAQAGNAAPGAAVTPVNFGDVDLTIPVPRVSRPLTMADGTTGLNVTYSVTNAGKSPSPREH